MKRRPHPFIALLLALVLALLAAPAALADDDHPQWRVTRYEPTITVDASGTATIGLDLHFHFGNDAGRGPYLTFPVRQAVRGNPDVWRLLDTKLVSVTSPTGASTEVKEEVANGFLTVRVGSEDRKNLRGVQQYVITYTVRGIVEPGASSGFDEVNFNVVGVGWEVPIEAVRVKLAGPGDIGRVSCFQGSSFAEGCNAAATGPDALFTAGPLRPGQGVQIVAGFPPGTFVGAEPEFAKRFHPGNLIPLNPMSAGLTAAVTGLGAVALMLARRRSADEVYVGLAPGTLPAPGEPATVGRVGPTPVAVQFHPPHGATPGEVGTLIDNSADTLDVSATLVDLAVRGHLTITELEKKKWRFDRRSSTDPLTPPEAQLLEKMFAHGPVLQTENEAEARAYLAASTATRLALDQRVTRELGWFAKKPSSAQGLAVLAGIGLILLGGAIGALLAFAAGLGLVGLAPIAIGVAVLVMSKRFVRRTAVGSAMLAQAKGFRLYLSTAEADQIKFEESIDVFSRYLPYAMVFGVAERWAKVFQQLAAEGRYEADTSWYIGVTPFHTSGFAHSVGSLGSSLGASTVTTSAPSSGGSGFSGGGGCGGGGGGGW